MAKKPVKKKETRLPIEIPIRRLIDNPYIVSLARDSAIHSLLNDLIDVKAKQLKDTRKAWVHFEELAQESVPEYTHETHVIEIGQSDPPFMKVSKR